MSGSGTRRLIILSGLSGAGKTVALHALEDLGFYCIDNLPVGLLGDFARQIIDSDHPAYREVAVGIDARNPPESLSHFPQVLQNLRGMGLWPELVFISASDDMLIKRFSETRRKHPLSSRGVPLPSAIRMERELLGPLAETADLRVDTSLTYLHQLRDLVRSRVARRPRAQLSLQFMSFGYKHGVPPDTDFAFDVRCLPNPHWEAHLRHLDGRDPQVAEFLESQPRVKEMSDSITAFLELWIPQFEADNRSYLTVALGCTGGHHRSVYLVERLAAHFQAKGLNVLASHRDI